MFRLVHFDEDNTDQKALYQYISSAVSKTITDCLDEYLDNEEHFYSFTVRIIWEDSFRESANI